MWLKPWAVNRTAWALNKRAHHQWQRLLDQVDPMVREVNKKLFPVGIDHFLPKLICCDEFYRKKFVVGDVVTFRAAAVATCLCNTVEEMEDWRTVFAPTGTRPYTSLNKTLTRLPGGVPLRLMARLREVILPRPIYNRSELITTLAATQGRLANFRVFAFASPDEIKIAMRRISHHLHDELRYRRARDIERAVQFMADYPEQHRGRIVGLAEKSIRWHREGREEEICKSISALGEQAACAMPPIQMPESEGIRFLSTVGEVCEEGRQMEHCVASYAHKAVEGSSYLFHVERPGDAATVEVNAFGIVTQALGPRNSKNTAAKWGTQQLAQWGKGFPAIGG